MHGRYATNQPQTAQRTFQGIHTIEAAVDVFLTQLPFTRIPQLIIEIYYTNTS